MNYSQKITIDAKDCEDVEKANYEVTAYKDLLSFCMAQGMAENDTFIKERQNFLNASAKFEKAKADIIAKYLSGKNVTDWKIDYNSRELLYNEVE